MSLFYATDFADRLENEIIPALRAGFDCSDGSLHLFAHGPRHRARLGPGMVARGRAALHLKPDAIFYLRKKIDDL